MTSSLLKWLASIGVGALTAALAWITGHTGTPGGIDPLIGGVVVAVLTKLVTWLTSKIPTSPTL